MTAGIPELLAASLYGVRGLRQAERVGVAVSGGGDSMALLKLLSAWCNQRLIKLHAVSVDHGIRQENGSECRAVRSYCGVLGVQHDTLAVTTPLTGNMQNAARTERYRLIADWAHSREIGFVALGHSLDDQAETFLLNLSRGSGVDGLAGMPDQVRRLGVCWIRPLLNVGRDELRQFLVDRDIDWVDDPSNDDPDFDRIKARQMLVMLGELGLSRGRLARTARLMQQAREVLVDAAMAAGGRVLAENRLGDSHFGEEFWKLPSETRLRLSADAIRRVSGSEYRPRLSALKSALEEVAGGRRHTLAGCMAVPGRGSSFWIVRELASCSGPVAADQCWDGRWRLSGKPGPAGSTIGALGRDGLDECRNWREAGGPRESLLASPSLWSEGRLLSAPFAGLDNGWSFARVKDDEIDR